MQSVLKIFGGYRELQQEHNVEALDFVKKVVCLPFLPDDDIAPTYQNLKDALSPYVRETLQPYLDSFDTWRHGEGNLYSVKGFIKLLINNAEIQNQVLRDVLGEQPSLWLFLSESTLISLSQIL